MTKMTNPFTYRHVFSRLPFVVPKPSQLNIDFLLNEEEILKRARQVREISTKYSAYLDKKFEGHETLITDRIAVDKEVPKDKTISWLIQRAYPLTVYVDGKPQLNNPVNERIPAVVRAVDGYLKQYETWRDEATARKYKDEQVALKLDTDLTELYLAIDVFSKFSMIGSLLFDARRLYHKSENADESEKADVLASVKMTLADYGRLCNELIQTLSEADKFLPDDDEFGRDVYRTMVNLLKGLLQSFIEATADVFNIKMEDTLVIPKEQFNFSPKLALDKTMKERSGSIDEKDTPAVYTTPVVSVF